MFNIIKSDFYRAPKCKNLIIALIIMLLLIGTSIYLIEAGGISMSVSIEPSDVGAGEVAEEYENEYQYTGVNGSMSEIRETTKKYLKGYELDRDILRWNINLYYVFIFIAVMAVSSDFSNGSVKNTLSSAISKRKYFISKLSFVVMGCLIFFYLNTFIMYFANLIVNGKEFSAGFRTVMEISLMQLPVVIALAGILNALAFICRKTAIFNTVAIPLVFIAQMSIDLLCRLVGKNVGTVKMENSFANYEADRMFRLIANNPTGVYVARCYIVCFAAFILFSTVGYIVFKKSEVR